MNGRWWIYAIGGVCAVGLGIAVAFDITRIPAIAGVGSLVLICAVLVWPAETVLVYAASRPLADLFVYVKVGSFTLGQIWGAGLICVVVAYGFTRLVLVDDTVRSPVDGRPDAWWIVPGCLLLGYAMFTLWRPDSSLAFVNTVRLSSWILLAMATSSICRSERGRRMTLRAGIAVAVLVLIVIAIAISQNRYGAAYYAPGDFGDIGQGPHGLASTAVMSLPFVLVGYLTARRPGVYGALVVLLGVAVVLSLVRTTFLAFLMILGAFMISALRRRGAREASAGIAGLVALAGAVYFAQGAVLDRLGDISFLFGGSRSPVWAGGGRIGIWQALLSAMAVSPVRLIYGLGAGASYGLVGLALGAEKWAHNDYIEMLVTGGIPLALLFATVVAWMAYTSREFRRSVAADPSSATVSAVMTATVWAWALMAFFNGMAFYQASIVMALLLGWMHRSGPIKAAKSAPTMAGAREGGGEWA